MFKAYTSCCAQRSLLARLGNYMQCQGSITKPSSRPNKHYTLSGPVLCIFIQGYRGPLRLLPPLYHHLPSILRGLWQGPHAIMLGDSQSTPGHRILPVVFRGPFSTRYQTQHFSHLRHKLDPFEPYFLGPREHLSLKSQSFLHIFGFCEGCGFCCIPAEGAVCAMKCK